MAPRRGQVPVRKPGIPHGSGRPAVHRRTLQTTSSVQEVTPESTPKPDPEPAEERIVESGEPTILVEEKTEGVVEAPITASTEGLVPLMLYIPMVMEATKGK